MTDNLKRFSEICLPPEESHKFVQLVKKQGINYGKGPSKIGFKEDWRIMDYLIESNNMESDIDENKNIKIYLTHHASLIPEKYWTEQMKKGAEHDLKKEGKLGSHFGCAAGDVIVVKNDIPFYLDNKISKNEVLITEKGNKYYTTGSIGEYSIKYFPNGDGRHFCLTFAKIPSQPDAKIYVVDMDALKEAVSKNEIQSKKFNNENIYIIQNIIKKIPEAVLELN